jgi:DNA-repair protein complementing XP-A cells
MGLTEEQKERIEMNKARALEIQKRRRLDQDAVEKGIKIDAPSGSERKRRKVSPKEAYGEAKEPSVEEANVALEEFEAGASEFVTKKEAMKMYCLPEGTLEVCEVTEKQNPRNKGWTPMKLFNRAEIRRRSRERWGGIEGLIQERQNREDKRFQKDLERAKDIFK